MNQPTISEQLREACNTIRTRSYRLADMIPLMQKAADEIDRLTGTPVGEAIPMSGTASGFTMAVFKGTDVPVGSKLYKVAEQDIRIGMLAADALGAG